MVAAGFFRPWWCDARRGCRARKSIVRLRSLQATVKRSRNAAAGLGALNARPPCIGGTSVVAEGLVEGGELFQGVEPAAVGLLLERHHVGQTDPAVGADEPKRDLALFEPLD